MNNEIINVTIYEEKFPADDSPLATVRYTEYDYTRKRVEKVNQVEYFDKEHFHSQVLQAVKSGLDVSICTQLSVKTLQKKLSLWTRQYYTTTILKPTNPYMGFKEEEVVTKKSTIDVQSGEVHKVLEKDNTVSVVFQEEKNDVLILNVF